MNNPESTITELKQNVLVSVCVPIYGVELYIERCVRSLMEQTMTDGIEFIFVNDCTPDASMEILQRTIADYPQRFSQVKIINHLSNKGLAAARNTAINYASGNYIIHVDSDDHLEIDAVQLMYKKSQEDNSDVVITDFNQITKDGTSLLDRKYSISKDDYLKLILTRKTLVNIIGVLINKRIIDDNDLFEPEGLNHGEDYLMYPKIIFYSVRISKIEKPLYNYNRVNVSSYSANISDKSVNDLILVQKDLVTFFTQNDRTAEYRQMINESCIYNKINLLNCAPLSSYDRIINLYDDIDYSCYNLSIKHKVLLCLCKYLPQRIIYQFIQLAKKLGY